MMERFCFVMSVTGLNICLILGEMKSVEDLVFLGRMLALCAEDLGLMNNQIECVIFCFPFSSCISGKVKTCVCEEYQVHQHPIFGKEFKILGTVLSGQRDMDSYLHCSWTSRGQEGERPYLEA
jgi:hypothetical protein